MYINKLNQTKRADLDLSAKHVSADKSAVATINRDLLLINKFIFDLNVNLNYRVLAEKAYHTLLLRHFAHNALYTCAFSLPLRRFSSERHNLAKLFPLLINQRRDDSAYFVIA
jgi:uncharacterized protein VirK/YbjX